MNVVTGESSVQGSVAWHAHRREHFNASDAPAMMGCSSFETRGQLIHRLATRIEKEVDSNSQKRFDDGHRFERLSRPLAEEIVGGLLYPQVGTLGKLSASFDGLTMEGDICYESKTLNDGIRACNDATELALMYRVQMEQQLLISGAMGCLFMASRFDDSDNLIEEKHFWYSPDLELRARIQAGWALFDSDLAAYVPTEAVVVPIAAPIRDLPAIRYQLNGLALTSNLSEFREAALVLVEDSKRELTTDQDFADTDARNKAFKTAEDKIELMAAQVLAEIEDVDKFTRDLKDVGALIRQARLNGEKKVTARKEAIRAEIVTGAIANLAGFIEGKNRLIGKPYMPIIPVDFVGAVKGKRTIASLQDAVDTELARAKIAANEIADRIQINLTALNAVATEFPQLFPDAAAIVIKPVEDFVNLVNSRVQAHKDAEAKRIEAARVAADVKAQLEEQAKAKAVDVKQPVSAPSASRFVAKPPPVSAQNLFNLLHVELADFTAEELTEVLDLAIAIKSRRQRAA